MPGPLDDHKFADHFGFILARREEAAFRTLVTRHGPMVYGTAI